MNNEDGADECASRAIEYSNALLKALEQDRGKKLAKLEKAVKDTEADTNTAAYASVAAGDVMHATLTAWKEAKQDLRDYPKEQDKGKKLAKLEKAVKDTEADSNAAAYASVAAGDVMRAALAAWKEAKQDLRESKMMDELERLQKNVKDAEAAYAEANAAPYAYAPMAKARRDLSDYLKDI
jgi:hypothetical protein